MDAWGAEFVVTCLPDDVMVASLGPDRQPWSGDDIVVPDLRDRADPFAGGQVEPSSDWAPDAGLSLDEWLATARGAARDASTARNDTALP